MGTRSWTVLVLGLLILAPALASATGAELDEKVKATLKEKLRDVIEQHPGAGTPRDGHLERIHPFILKDPAQQQRVIIEYEDGYGPVQTDLELSSIRPAKLGLINAGKATLHKADIKALAKKKGVKAIWPDLKVNALLADSVSEINTTAYTNLGYNGTGIKIAVLDTGIHDDHVDLDGGKVVAGKDFTASGYWTDDNGHGTHVACIAAGTGEAGIYNTAGGPGVANDASLISVKVLDNEGSGYTSDIIEGMQWASDNGADIISMSLGSQPGAALWLEDPLSRAVNAIVDRGVIVVAASGNSGPGIAAVSSPGSAEKAITVGASNGTSMAYFSSPGPTIEGRIKPDVVAPGYNITSCDNSTNNAYIEHSGTSMASPFVAGLAALIKQAHPALTPEEVKAVIMANAEELGAESIYQGAGKAQARLGGFYALPPSIFFGIVSENSSCIQNVTFKSLDGSSLNITLALSDQANGTAANWTTLNQTDLLLPYNSTLLNLTVPAGTPAGTYYGRLIAANDTNTVTVPFSVTVPIDLAPGMNVTLNNTWRYLKDQVSNSNEGDYHYYFINATTYLDQINITINSTSVNATLSFIYPGLNQLGPQEEPFENKTLSVENITQGMYWLQVHDEGAAAIAPYELTLSTQNPKRGEMNVTVYEVDPATGLETGNRDVRQGYTIGLNVTFNNTDPAVNHTVLEMVYIYELDEYERPHTETGLDTDWFEANYSQPVTSTYAFTTNEGNTATRHMVQVYLFNDILIDLVFDDLANITYTQLQLSNTTFELLPTHYNNISGYVYNVSDGMPVNGANVSLWHALNDTYSNSTLTDATGVFYFNHSVGIWEARASKAGYITLAPEENIYLQADGVTTDPDQLDPANLTFHLYPEGQGRVRVNATNQLGKTINNLTFYTYKDGNLAYTRSSILGNASFMLPGDTNYTVYPYQAGFTGLRNYTFVTLHNGTDVFVTMELTDIEKPTVLEFIMSNTTPEVGDTVDFIANATDNDAVFLVTLVVNSTPTTFVSKNMDLLAGNGYNASYTPDTVANATAFALAYDYASLGNSSWYLYINATDTRPPSLETSTDSTNYGTQTLVWVNTSDKDLINPYLREANLTYPNGTTFVLLPQTALVGSNNASHTLTWNQYGNHTLTVFANDTSGNYNTTSINYTVTDTEAPTISSCTYTPHVATVGVDQEITCTITDNDPLTTITSWANLTQGTSYNITYLEGTGSTFKKNISLYNTGSNNLYLYANDTYGNLRAVQSDLYIHPARYFNYSFTVETISVDRTNIGWYDNFSSWWIGDSAPARQVPATTLDVGMDFDASQYGVVFRDIDLSTDQYVDFNVTELSNATVGENKFIGGFALETNLTFADVMILFRNSNPNSTHLLVYKSPYNFNTEVVSGWTLLCNNSANAANPCGHSNHSLGIGSSSEIYLYANTSSLSAFALFNEPFCGDGTCQSTENCATCNPDCGRVGYACCAGVLHIGNCCGNEQCPYGQVCIDYTCIGSSSTTIDTGGGGGGGGGETPTLLSTENLTIESTTTNLTTLPQQVNKAQADFDSLENRINLLLSIMEDVPLTDLILLQQAQSKIDEARKGEDNAQSLLFDANRIIASQGQKLPVVHTLSSRTIDSLNSPELSKGYKVTPTNQTLSRTARVVNIQKSTGNETRTLFTLPLQLHPSKNVTCFERIPKEVAANATDIVFNYPPNILEEDPLVAWAFPASAEPVDIIYYVKRSLDLSVLPPFESVTAYEITLECGDSVCDPGEQCCEDCGCPQGGTCNTETHWCDMGLSIPGLPQFHLQWYHYGGMLLMVLVLGGALAYLMVTRQHLLLTPETLSEAGESWFSGKADTTAPAKPIPATEMVLVLNKVDASGYWYAVMLEGKKHWLYSKTPISFPAFVTGELKKAGDSTYLEAGTASVIDHQEKQSIKDVLASKQTKASIQGSCKCVVADSTGYWYELMDFSGKMPMHTKKPIYVYGKLKLLKKGEYFLIDVPHLMKSEVLKIVM